MKKVVFCLLFGLAPLFTAYSIENVITHEYGEYGNLGNNEIASQARNDEAGVQEYGEYGSNEVQSLRSGSDAAAIPSNTGRKVFDAKQLIAPAALMTTGTLIHCFAHDTWDNSINKAFIDFRGDGRRLRIDDVFEYVPITAFIGLDLLGVEAKKDHFDRLLHFHLALFPSLIISRGLKLVVNSPRPDYIPKELSPTGKQISDTKSFPSGHTTMTFLGAELIRMEYGLGWGLGAYAIALSTATLRMYNQKHWFSDVLMGAGIGILSAHIGEWLLEPVKGWISPLFKKNTTLATTLDPISGAPCMALCYSF